MRVLVALALCGFASCSLGLESLRPVISLDLGTDHHIQKYTTAQAGVPCNGLGGREILTSHLLCRSREGVNKAGNRFSEKFSKTCVAGISSLATCHLPEAKAYDHQDGRLGVKEELFLINDDGSPPLVTSSAPGLQRSLINWSKRSEYVIKYDAADSSGNQAEQVLFALILDDPIPPVISFPKVFPATLESCNRDNVGQDPKNRRMWKLLPSAIAYDNIDKDLSSKMKIMVVLPGGGAVEYNQGALLLEGSWVALDTHTLGVYTIEYSVHDHAGMFGLKGHDNSVLVTKKLRVQDTLAPNIYCKKAGCNRHSVLKVTGTKITKVATAHFNLCCDACENQRWNRAVGTDVSKDEPECAFFHFVKKYQRCTLYAANVTASIAMIDAETESGSPLGCDYTPHECGKPYTDAGARCIDMRDSIRGGVGGVASSVNPNTLASKLKHTSAVDIDTNGEYQVKYTCTDLAGNKKVHSRKVVVGDHQLPSIKLVGGEHQFLSPGNPTLDDYLVLGKSYQCQDLCTCSSGCSSSNSAVIYKEQCPGTYECLSEKGVPIECNGGDEAKASVVDIAHMKTIPGTYAIKYTCSDSTHSVSKCRTMYNIPTDGCVYSPWGPWERVRIPVCKQVVEMRTRKRTLVRYFIAADLCTATVDSWVQCVENCDRDLCQKDTGILMYMLQWKRDTDITGPETISLRTAKSVVLQNYGDKQIVEHKVGVKVTSFERRR
jgi:hypothetical protein